MLENLLNPDTDQEHVDTETTCAEALQGINSLPENIRSITLLGLEELSSFRNQMRHFVLETTERNLYRNIYKPASITKDTDIAAGDICVWQQPSSSRLARRPRGKVVRIVQKIDGYPQRYLVQFYLTGERRPPKQSSENRDHFTSTVVSICELLRFCHNVDASSDPTEDELDAERVEIDEHTDVVEGIRSFADTIRMLLKENNFFRNKPAKEEPSSENVDAFFKVLDDGAATFIADHGAINQSTDRLIALKDGMAG